MKTHISFYITLGILLFSSSFATQTEEAEGFDFQSGYDVGYPFGKSPAERIISIAPPFTTSAPMKEIIRLQQQIAETDEPALIDSLVSESLLKWDLLSPGAALLGAMKGSAVCLHKLCQYELFPTDYPLDGILRYIETGELAPTKRNDTEMKALGYGLHEPTLADMPEALAAKWKDIITHANKLNTFVFTNKISSSDDENLCECPYPISSLISQEMGISYLEFIDYYLYAYSFNIKNRDAFSSIFIRCKKSKNSSFLPTIETRKHSEEKGRLSETTISFHVKDYFSLIISKNKLKKIRD